MPGTGAETKIYFLLSHITANHRLASAGTEIQIQKLWLESILSNNKNVLIHSCVLKKSLLKLSDNQD